MIRLAASMPKGSPGRKALLEVLARDANPGLTKQVETARNLLDTVEGSVWYRLYDRKGRVDIDGNPVLSARDEAQAKVLHAELKDAQALLTSISKRLQKTPLDYTS
jgi:hypothetical protein